MFTFERSILVRAPIQKLYEFHLYTPNAKLIQPWGMKVEHVDLPDEIKVGAEVILKIRAYGLPQTWQVRWAELEPPSGSPAKAHVTDEALKSPFKSFRHRHEFTEEKGGTRLRDFIQYQPPFGFIGNALQPLMHFQLDAMFYTRQRLTKRILEASMNPLEAPADMTQASAFFSVQIAADKHRQASEEDDESDKNDSNSS